MTVADRLLPLLLRAELGGQAGVGLTSRPRCRAGGGGERGLVQTGDGGRKGKEHLSGKVSLGFSSTPSFPDL